MLDIKLIRDNPDQVKQGIAAKGFDAGLVDKIAPLEAEVRQLQTEIEGLRAERNKLAQLGPHAAEQGRKIKQQLDTLQEKFTGQSAELQNLLGMLPNLPASDVPVGEGESANTVIKTVGEKPRLDNPLDHVE